MVPTHVWKTLTSVIIDLFGRGYSSAPDPKYHNYDSSLYTSQILLCLQSSPISWGTFTIVGYSLGGALAADFTSYFPNLVKGLVLVAPGGIIRTRNISFMNRFLYSSGFLPEWMVRGLVGSKLRTGSQVQAPEENPEDIERAETASMISVSTSASTSTRRTKAVFLSSDRLLLHDNPYSTVSAVVDWQIQNHQGFVPAFISTIRHAPIHNQQERWSIIRDHIERRRGGSGRDHDKKKKKKSTGFFDKKKSSRRGGLNEVWLVLGETDPIIIKDEVVEDAKEVLGEDNVMVKVVHGVGHEVAIERADVIADVVGKTLGMGRE